MRGDVEMDKQDLKRENTWQEEIYRPGMMMRKRGHGEEEEEEGRCSEIQH